MYTACKNGDLKKLKQVCEKYKTILKITETNLNNEFLYRGDPQGFFPLDLTVINDRLECCKFLFETYNLNPLQVNPLGSSALAYSIDLNRITYLRYFIENSKRYLPTRTIDDFLTLVPCTSAQQSAFQVAIESSNPNSEKVLILLLSYLKINFQLRKSLFIGCIKACNTVLIECILNFNNPKDEERRELINLPINLSKNYMKKSLISEANSTPLIYAIHKKDRQLINYLLSQDGVDINLANNPIMDENPLQVAIKLNDIETMINLIEKGVNKSIRLRGVLPIELTLELRVNLMNLGSNADQVSVKENLMVIELLATSPNDVHIQNDKGECPFDYAVKNKMTDIIEHFLSIQGKLFDRENQNGKSPIDYAPDMEYRKFLMQKFNRQYREHRQLMAASGKRISDVEQQLVLLENNDEQSAEQEEQNHHDDDADVVIDDSIVKFEGLESNPATTMTTSNPKEDQLLDSNQSSAARSHSSKSKQRQSISNNDNINDRNQTDANNNMQQFSSITRIKYLDFLF